MLNKKNYHLQLSGLTCSACQKVAASRLKKIAGMQSVKVELNGAAQTSSDGEISEAEVQNVLSGTPYNLVSMTAQN